MTHHFDTRIAELISIEAAVIFCNITFWVDKNKANEKHFYDDRYWTYNSVAAFEGLFPYMTNHKIKKALTDLEEKGFIVTGNYNKSTYDRTKWYSYNDILHLLKTANGSDANSQPIPYTNTVSKTDSVVLSETKVSDFNPLLINFIVSEHTLTEIKITKAFFDLIRHNQIESGVTTFTNYDKTKLKSWLIHVERLIKLDGVSITDIKNIYTWLSKSNIKNSDFWKKNILSTKKLREKFPQLQTAMQEDVRQAIQQAEKENQKRDTSRLGL